VVSARYDKLRRRHLLEMEGFQNEADMLKKRLTRIEKLYKARTSHISDHRRMTMRPLSADGYYSRREHAGGGLIDILESGAHDLLASIESTLRASQSEKEN
jgi:hypothetical protein